MTDLISYLYGTFCATVPDGPTRPASEFLLFARQSLVRNPITSCHALGGGTHMLTLADGVRVSLGGMISPEILPVTRGPGTPVGSYGPGMEAGNAYSAL